MIEISCIDGKESRPLTDKERLNVIATHCDGVKYTHYEKGEQVPEIAPSLEDLKSLAHTLIDEQAKQNIYAGFTYKNTLISMSDHAQKNWTNFPNLKDSRFNAPGLPIMSKDDRSVILLQLSEKMDFYYAAQDHVANHQIAAGQRKLQVNACTTVEQLKNLATGWGLSI